MKFRMDYVKVMQNDNTYGSIFTIIILSRVIFIVYLMNCTIYYIKFFQQCSGHYRIYTVLSVKK